MIIKYEKNKANLIIKLFKLEINNGKNKGKDAKIINCGREY
jgi:hypothetical protein